jgi:hypothetical protein
MKTSSLFSILVVLLLFNQGNTQSYIWGGPGDNNSEFNGGLNDWTVVAVNPNANALWVWEADGKADKGGYWNNRNAIKSPSVSNGAMVFDSDFYDNAGIQGNQGKGIAPGSQTGELISPVFSCTGHTSVWLKFNQYYRNWKSTPKFSVSIDGGTTWATPITLNGDIKLNFSTTENSQILYDISNLAAGHANVRIKFIWEGEYYFWIIDDVAIIDTPAGDPKIMGTWYPPMHYGIAQNMANRDSMYFIMDVNNTGGKALTGIEGKITLYNDNLQKVFYTESKTFDLGINDTFRVFFDSYMAPANLDTGLYVALYEIKTDQAATTNGKSFIQYFRIYPNLFDRTEGGKNIYKTRFRNTDSSLDGGVSFQGSGTAGPIYDSYNINYYKMGDWVESPNYKISAVSTTLSVTMGTTGDLISYPGTIRVFELADTLDNLLWNFDFLDGIGLDGKESKQLFYVGYGFKQIENVAKYANVDVEITDLDENGYLDLKPNKKYFVGALWEKGTRYYQGYDNTNGSGNKRFFYYLNNLYQTVSYTYVSNDQRFYVLGSDYGAWAMDLNIELSGFTNTSEDQLLPANSVTIQENPLRDVLSVDLQFENSIDHATIVIHDLKGSIIELRNVYNLKESTETFQVGSFPAGQYVFTIFTKDKMLSKKFVVIK